LNGFGIVDKQIGRHFAFLKEFPSELPLALLIKLT
jgi:hypothetical protein